MGHPSAYHFSGKLCRCDPGKAAYYLPFQREKTACTGTWLCGSVIWIAAVSQIVGNANNNILAYLAYATGFAVGNYVGMVIEERLAIATLVIRIILSRNGNPLFKRLREEGYGVTFVDGQGANGPVLLGYTIVLRKELELVICIIEETASKAFFTVEELRSVRQGVFPVRSTKMQGDLFGRKKK
jgi:uncharacterized protein YebE (UPF0316 family)